MAARRPAAYRPRFELMAPLPPLINSYSGVVSCTAECSDCSWTYESHKNGLALASQHARRTGHEVRADQALVVTYNRKDRTTP
jgi:hypothetical protein